jgi:hypothetical protein
MVGVPVGVLYDFAFEGLLPAIEARVRMDYDRCYERFAAALSGEFYYVRAELGTDLKWLREHDAIDIDIDSLVDEAGRAERERRVMALVQARVEQDFFKSAMPTKPTGAAGPLSGLLSGLLGPEEPEASSAMFVLKARFELEVELKTFEMDLHERIAQTFSHVSAGQLAWMFEGREPNVVEMELGEDFFRRLELRVVRAFDPAQLPGFVRCVVDVEHPRASRSFVLGAEETLEHRLSVPLAPGEARTYRWRVRFEFEEGVGHGPATLEGGPFESDRLVLAVGSESAVDWSRVRLVTTPWLDGVDSYLAQVRVFVPGRRRGGAGGGERAARPGARPARGGRAAAGGGRGDAGRGAGDDGAAGRAAERGGAGGAGAGGRDGDRDALGGPSGAAALRLRGGLGADGPGADHRALPGGGR